MTPLRYLLLVSILLPFEQSNELSHKDQVLISNFESGKSDWKERKKNCSQHYEIVSDNENSFLHVETKSSNCFIIKKMEVDIAKYQYLNWKWRANNLPEDGAENIKKVCDSAASISCVLNQSKFFPKSIKYTWSSTLEKDTYTKSPYAYWPAKCDIRVIQEGDRKKGEWITEKVNILNDFKKLYDEEDVKSKMVYAIVIMTDADNTQTLSSADYDDIYFSTD